MLSNRSKKIKAQPMFDIMEDAKILESQGRVIAHLEIGDSSSFENVQLHNLVKKNLADADSLQYSPSEGESRLREAFIFHYSILCNHEFTKEEVVVTPANAAVSQLFDVLADEGEHVLIPDPGFPTYSLAAVHTNIEPVYYKLEEKNNFQLNLDEIFSLIESDPQIKLFVLNSPSNPLGIFHNLSDIDKLVRFCKEKDIYVIWDDTYRNLIYKDKLKRTVRHQDNIFYIYSLSKDMAAPALRIGCVIGERMAIKKIANHNSLFYSCLPKFIQLAAADYLFEDQRPYRKSLRIKMIDRIEKVVNILKSAPNITYIEPNSGIYFFLNISQSNLNGEKFANKLLEDCGVCVCPGINFGSSGKEYIRICISGEGKVLYESIEKIVVFFNNLVSVNNE